MSIVPFFPLFFSRNRLFSHHIISALVIGALCGSVFGQRRPFPQEVEYAAGFTVSPSILSSADVKANYDAWKAKYLSQCAPGELRVENFEHNPSTTYSEGQGYGMILAAYMADKDAFDKMWAFAQKAFNANGLMGWQSTCNNFAGCNGWTNSCGSPWGSSSATDGDLDIIIGLCIAADQWGGTYESQAKEYITRLKNHNFWYFSENNRWLQGPLDSRNRNSGNTSYWIPGYYRVFKKVTGDSDWDKIIEDTYWLLFKSRHSSTGLFGDVVAFDGSVSNPAINYNGCRIPWRLMTDYAWTGDSQAKDLLDKQCAWALSMGTGNISDGENYNGVINPGGWFESPAFMGGWAAGMMSQSQEAVDEWTKFLVEECTHDNYYNTSLRILYQLMLTGNYWMPLDGSEPTSAAIKMHTGPIADISIFAVSGGISISGLPATRSKVELVAPNGSVVQRFVPQTTQMQIDRFKVASGMYFLKISTPFQSRLHKIRVF